MVTVELAAPWFFLVSCSVLPSARLGRSVPGYVPSLTITAWLSATAPMPSVTVAKAFTPNTANFVRRHVPSSASAMNWPSE